MTSTAAPAATFLSVVVNTSERVHVKGCKDIAKDLRRSDGPAYEVSGNLRDLTIESFSDIWSDTYETTEEAIKAGELVNYANAEVHVCNCAKRAGFDMSLEAPAAEEIEISFLNEASPLTLAMARVQAAQEELNAALAALAEVTRG